ncbi:MAG: DUF4268 domain-containing protein [bacterium]|nr:DUF4268 domain-containing protein [Acidimicrobiia bacterium]MCY4649759.1 DUF4268 domain-containing protein [bacterium]
MSGIDIGTLEGVAVHKVWPREAGDFTPWLAANVQLVSDAMGMDLELDDQEVSVGNYRADLVLKEVSSGALVVVENMYGQTDHDHIGKLITYAAGLNASYAVLLAESFRPEHRSALNWLNSISKEDCGFFGLGLETWRIGDSKPAPRLRVDVQPDDWSRSVRAGKDRKESERSLLLRRFWAEMQSSFRTDSRDWAGRGKPPREAWMTFKSRMGVQFNVTFCRPGNVRRLRCEAYIDTGDKESTAELYEAIESRCHEIEKAFGDELEWSRLEGRRASRISSYFPEPIGFEEEDRWPEAREWAVAALGRLRSAVESVLWGGSDDSRFRGRGAG